MKKLTVGSLFAGIGGFDLGLERTGGFEVVWQCEIDPYCQRVLAKHWPHVKRYGDIRELRDVEPVDVLCGGFPCQDISNAGNCEGIDGERSGLWSEYVRLIRLLQPRYVVVENVAALLGRGMGRVLGDLSESGLDAEWDCLPAEAFGSPQQRDRVWIIAGLRTQRRQRLLRREQAFRGVSSSAWPATPLDTPCATLQHLEKGLGEPAIFGSNDGLSSQVDRLAALGNAVVPQVVEWIGNRIIEYERLTVN